MGVYKRPNDYAGVIMQGRKGLYTDEGKKKIYIYREREGGKYFCRSQQKVVKCVDNRRRRRSAMMMGRQRKSREREAIRVTVKRGLIGQKGFKEKIEII